MEINKKTWPLSTTFKLRDRINTDTDYQRPPVWTTAQKQMLMDSILRGYDVPKFYWHKVSEKQYDVVDGQQRLRAIWEFMDNKYALAKDADPIDGVEIAKIKYPDLIYNYLVKLCNKIFYQLVTIAISNKLDIRNLTDYYLDLCKKDIEEIKNQKMKKIIKIKKTQNQVTNENKSNRKKEKNKNSFYSSYANLFIGDVEENSVFQRYLSNILVLSSQKIFAHGSYVDFSKNYVKNFVNKMNYISELSRQKDANNLSINSLKLNLQNRYMKKNFERKIFSYKDSKNVSINNQLRKVNQKINKSSSMNNLFPSHYFNNNDSLSISNSRINILKKPIRKVPKKNKIVKYFLSKNDFYYE